MRRAGDPGGAGKVPRVGPGVEFEDTETDADADDDDKEVEEAPPLAMSSWVSEICRKACCSIWLRSFGVQRKVQIQIFRTGLKGTTVIISHSWHTNIIQPIEPTRGDLAIVASAWSNYWGNHTMGRRRKDSPGKIQSNRR